MLILGNLNGGKEEKSHSFIAGLFGGYIVFGAGKHSFNSVNQQIVIYIFARVVLATAKLIVTPASDNALVGSQYGGRGGRNLFGLNQNQLNRIKENSWPVFASLSWASVMWLFRFHPEMLQPSLRSSMQYMYVSSLPTLAFLPNLLVLLLCFTLQEREHGLTDACCRSDTIMQTTGTAREISSGSTDDEKKRKQKKPSRSRPYIAIHFLCAYTWHSHLYIHIMADTRHEASLQMY